MSKQTELAQVADTITVNSGKVGIGTDSPARTLEVYSSAPAIKLNNGTNAFTIGTGAFVDGSNSLVFFDEGVGERMRIDSAGRVTKPNQPVFFAQGGSSYAEGTGQSVVLFGFANPNVGSHYNTTNGRFTAPVAGNYFFSTQVRIDNPNVSYFRVHIRKNGTVSFTQPHSIYDFGTNWDPRYASMPASGAIALAANDYVEVVIDSSTDTSITVHPNESGFSGYLIG